MEHKLVNSGVFETVCLVLSSLATLFFGTWIPLMTTLLVLNATDIATGFLKSGKKHIIGSRAFYRGIQKKVGQWILIIVANAIDVVAFDGLPVAKTGVVGALIGTEGVSIVENLAEMGVWIPKSVKKYLVQIRAEEKIEEKVDEMKKVDNN